MKAVLVPFLMLLVGLAGCSDSTSEEPDVIVVSGNVIDPAKANATQAPRSGKEGHIAGFVVDETVQAIAGATVTLVQLDLKDVTDRKGNFEFVDLKPATYLVRINKTGHQDAEALLDVKAGQFTRAKVVLHRILPPEPFHETQKFSGFVDVTNHQIGGTLIIGVSLYCECHWDVDVPQEGLHSMVAESTMEPYNGLSGAGSNGFRWYLRDDDCCTTYHSSSQENPFWLELPAEELRDDERIEISVYPWSSPLVEMNKEFEVFLTAFYNGPPPAGWSVVEGSD